VDDAPADYRLLHGAAYMAMLCLGVSAATIGPVLPFLADDVDVSLDTAGLLLTAFFVGSITSSALIAVALHGRDSRVLVLAGLALEAAGTIGLAFAPSFELILIAGVIVGLGDGLVVAATHILMPATTPVTEDIPAAVNRMNIYFALGAIAGPLWTGAILATTGDRWIVYTGIFVLLLVAIAVTLAADAAVPGAIETPDQKFSLPGTPTAWIMGAVLFLYVGAEFGLGAWVSTFAQETADAGVFGSALIAAGYWAALAGGRFATAWYLARGHDVVVLLLAGCAGAGIAALVLIATSGSVGLAAASAMGAGFFLGPVWPAVTAIVSREGVASSTAATVTVGNAGGVAIPWLQGKVLVGSGATQGVAVTAVLCALMFVITAIFRTRGVERHGAVERVG
jgi:fucose permease